MKHQDNPQLVDMNYVLNTSIDCKYDYDFILQKFNPTFLGSVIIIAIIILIFVALGEGLLT